MDGRGLAGPERGVGRYALRVAEELAAGGDRVRVLLPQGGRLPAGCEGVGDGRGILRAAAQARRGTPPIDAPLGRCDVVWAPAPRPLALPRAPFVLTVHDRTWEERPADFTAYERLWHRAMRAPRLARAARHVLFDSERVREAVSAAWSLDAAATSVARPGVDAGGASPEALRRARALVAAHAPRLAELGDRPFLLYVGALEPRKGLDVLLAAHARARDAGGVLPLVVVGSGRTDVAAPDVHALGRVDDDVLAGLYALARALVLPSRREGYGLTPLEARHHGTPTIASDLPVLRETLSGEGATFVPAEDVGALAAALADPPEPPAAGAPVPRWTDTARDVRSALAAAAAG